MKTKIYLVIIATLCASVFCSAQKESIVEVKNIRGEYNWTLRGEHLNLEEAENRALLDAKRKAVERVCGEQINVWGQLQTTEVGQSLTSTILSQSNGELVEWQEVEKGDYQSEIDGVITVFYVINAKVKKGNLPDPKFTATVDGLKSVYLNGEKLNFEVKSHTDAHLTIFLMENEQTGYKLFPNSGDKNTKLLAEKVQNPLKNSDLIVEKSTKKPKETNFLIFVFTKTERPFLTNTTSWATIEKWIAQIPNNEKFLIFTPFEIREK